MTALYHDWTEFNWILNLTETNVIFAVLGKYIRKLVLFSFKKRKIILNLLVLNLSYPYILKFLDRRVSS